MSFELLNRIRKNHRQIRTHTQVEESAQIPLKKMQEMTGMSGI